MIFVQPAGPVAFKPRITGGWYELSADVRERAAERMPDGGHDLHIYEQRLTPTERLVVFTEQHPMDVPARRGWHLSISHQVLDERGVGRPGRYPTWDEIKDVRYRFTPSEVEMCMVLPRPADFVNMHETCFHLHQHFEPGDGA